MCLIVFSTNDHKKYKLVFAANRDEFYNRETMSAHFWNDHPELLAGKDLKEGGTWMGITKSGKLAAITNYRDFKNIKDDAPSRGNLTKDFLLSSSSADEYYSSLKDSLQEYNGFNLILGNVDQLYYFSNYSDGLIKLNPGIYGLSNALLDTPWEKVVNTKNKFAEELVHNKISSEKLFNILSDDKIYPDDKLPDTGAGLKLERVLSSAFIKSPVYGTRSSTVLLVDKENNVNFIEITYDHLNDSFNEEVFQFKIVEKV